MSFLSIQWWNQVVPTGRMGTQFNYVFIGTNGRAYTSVSLRDSAVGNVYQGGPATTPYATNQVAGFFNVAGTNGIPAGVPITETGKCPITIDVVNNVLYFYNAGSWRAAGGGGGASALTINTKTSAYTVVSGDLGKIINCTLGTSFTVSLTSASTLGSGWYCWVWNSGTGAITIDPNGTETINGNTTIVLRPNEGLQIVSDGSNWIAGDQKYISLFAGSADTADARPNASGVNSVAIGLRASATLSASSAIGANSASQGSASSGSGSMALGGSWASGIDSFAAGIGDNSSSYGSQGSNSIALGFGSLAFGQESVAIGSFNTASGQSSLAVGYSNTASSAYSWALGLNAQSAVYGKIAYASGPFSSNGTAQSGSYTLRRSGSSGPIELTTNGSAVGATPNQIVLRNWQALSFIGTVVVHEGVGGSNYAAWRIEGLIYRGSTAATTTLVASTATVISNTPGWSISLTADTTRGSLAIRVTPGATTAYALANVMTAEAMS